MNKEITKDTPIVMLTVGQLSAYIKGKPGTAVEADQDTDRKNQGAARQEPKPVPSKFVYGLRGIRNRYGVGLNTACTWASGLLAPAVLRDGRKIIVDTEKADKLLEQWTQEQRQRKAAR